MNKKTIAFICVHNACRSQIAEALGRLLLPEHFVCCSAGTQTRPQIEPGAVRLMQQRYGIDMTQEQYSKTITEIPTPDILISMGCGVQCPYVGRPFDEDWGLPDPTGQPDAVYFAVMDEIEQRLRQLAQRYQ